MNHTVMALAAPCDLSTSPDPDLASSDGSSASNFILISYKPQKSAEGNGDFKNLGNLLFHDDQVEGHLQ